jgi:uncharacterized membrane protein SirB2
MDYVVLKSIHQSMAALSFAGFVARGVGMLRDARWLQARVVRTAPHVVDTILLASAVALVWTIGLSPIHRSWLVAKIVGLLVYIGLGFVALRLGRSKTVRAIAWGAAMVVFAYIVSVAVSKDPLGFVTWLR